MTEHNNAVNQLYVRQINGCRHFGPPCDSDEFIPAEGSEVFVARIPKDFPERELIKIFCSVGTVYDIRLMVNFFKENKGYAFVRYCTPSMAAEAINQLNGYRLPSGKSLAAMISSDHRTLMLTGCSSFVSKQEVEKVFRTIAGDEVLQVTESRQPSPVFHLLFATHRRAAVTKRGAWAEHIPKHWGPYVHLHWQPNKEVDDRIRWKNLKKRFSLMLEKESMKALSPVCFPSPEGYAVPTRHPALPNIPRASASVSAEASAPDFDLKFIEQILDDHEEEWNQENIPPNIAGASGGSNIMLEYNKNTDNHEGKWNQENVSSNISAGLEAGAWGGSNVMLENKILTDNHEGKWNQENVSSNISAGLEAGAWGGSNVMLENKILTDNHEGKWNQENFSSNISAGLEAGAWGGSNVMLENKILTDGRTQNETDWRAVTPPAAPVGRRPILGRSFNDQRPSTMRF